jgi:hypothetical protein
MYKDILGKADSGGPLMCLHNGERVVCGTSAFGTGEFVYYINLVL